MSFLTIVATEIIFQCVRQKHLRRKFVMRSKSRFIFIVLLFSACLSVYVNLLFHMDIFYTEKVTSESYALPMQKGSYVTGNNLKGGKWRFLILNSHTYTVNTNKTYHVIDRVVYSKDYSLYTAERESPAAKSHLQDYVRDFGEEKQDYLSNYLDDLGNGTRTERESPAAKSHLQDYVRDFGEEKQDYLSNYLDDLGNGTRKLEQIVANRYRLEKVIGKEYFGDIYLGTDLKNNERKVVIKMENARRKHSYLRLEHEVYNAMNGGAGIPKVIWHGREGQSEVMVMEPLGPSLQDRLVSHSGKFCLRIVLFLAEALINIFEYIHSKGYIYRDVNPQNFLTGLEDIGNVIYVSNFRSSKRFRDAKTHKHIPYVTNKTFVGSLEYASINSQLGIQQSRRDDMESLGYVLVYFLRGTLPWSELRYETKKEKYAFTLDWKMAVSIEDLCPGCPLEFFFYIKLCQSMRFDERPNYPRLRQLFRNVSKAYNFTSDKTFGWKDDATLGQDNGPRTSISPYVKRWSDKE